MRTISIPDELDIQIIELLQQGYAPKEIAHKLWKSKPTIHCRLSRLRKHYGCKTTYELISKNITNYQEPLTSRE